MNLKKMLILSVMLIATTILSSQNRDIPKEFKEEWRILKEKIKAAKAKKADVILDFWGEQIPQVSVNALADGGTWAYSNLGFDVNYSKLMSGCQRKVAVFIFDTGGKYTHPGLQAVAANDFGKTFTGEAIPDDGNGHSTHVAGTYGGIHPNGLNVGLCKAMVEKGLLSVIPYKVLGNDGSGGFGWIEAGIADANRVAQQLISQGYGVVYSFSLGGGTSIYQPIADRLKAAANMGVIIVAAAGNSGQEGVNYPGADPSAQAIGALELVNGQMQWTYFSTFGDKVFEATPGNGIFSTYPPADYKNLSGTSMATPAAGAVFATLLSYFPKATTAQILDYVQKQLTDLPPTGKDKKTGYGVPIMTRLLSGDPGTGNPTPPTPPVPPAPPTPPTPPAPPVIPVKPSIWTAGIAIPPGDLYYQLWKTKSQTKSQTLKISGLVLEIQSNLYAENLYDFVQQKIGSFFNNSMLVVRDSDDYVTTTAFVGHFLRMYLETQLAQYNIKVTIKEISGQDGLSRYTKLLNPIQPTLLETNEIKRLEAPQETTEWWINFKN